MFKLRRTNKFIEVSYNRPTFQVSLDFSWYWKEYERPGFRKYTANDSRYFIIDLGFTSGTLIWGNPVEWWT